MLRVGIIGLPNVGKSSLFNALTAAGAPAENYPFCTVEPNVGIVAVPDVRLGVIHALAGSAEQVPAFIEFVDIAGLVKGASEGEGLGNQFLGHIREVDALIHVLRCFPDPGVSHVMGTIDPVRDLEIVEIELALADLEAVERRWEKTEKKARSGEKDAIRELEALRTLRAHLEQGTALRDAPLDEDGRSVAAALGLLSVKPVVYVANVSEQNANEPAPTELCGALADKAPGLPLVAVASGIEAELTAFEPEERRAFLKEMGLEETGLERVVRAAFDALGLITFFSTNEKQTHAWAVPAGTKAPQAAGVIHTDFEKGFIRAEAIGFEEFVAAGSMKRARELGAIRSEGRDYVVQDGDILLFRFHL